MNSVYFVSHASCDKARASELAQSLRKRMVDPWLASERVAPGEYYASAIAAAIADATALILLLSEQSLASAQVRREVDTAVGEGVPVLPVLLSPGHQLADLPPEWRYLLRVTQWVDWMGADNTAAKLTGVPSPTEASHFDRSPSDPVSKNKIYVADSTLLVVKSYLEASGLETVLREAGTEPRFVAAPWSSHLLHQLADGDLDLCVYNEAAVVAFAQTHPGVLEVVSHAGYSMGGNNFSVLAKEGSKWDPVTMTNFAGALSADTRVYVGVNTDRWTNFLTATGLSHAELTTIGVKVINTPEPGLEVLDADPDALLVSGQNARFEAVLRGGVREVIKYHELSDPKRAALRRSSSNVLIVRAETARDLTWDLPALAKKFRSSAGQVWADEQLLEDLVERLTRVCEFQVSGRRERERIARHVLYETYRAGEPTL